MAEFVLNVNDIDEAGKDFAFPVTAAWLATALADTEVVAPANRGDSGSPRDGELNVRAQKQGEDVFLQGRLKAELVTQCGRCLNDARIAVDTAVTSLLSMRSDHVRPPADEVELTPQDLDREFYTGDRIVLDAIVREHLLLEVPIQPLCADDCAGIPIPEAVKGPSIDPRLAPLMKLAEELEPTEE